MSPLGETYRAEERAEWENLLAMAAQGGRPVRRRDVQRLGRKAGVPAAEVARVAAEIGAVS